MRCGGPCQKSKILNAPPTTGLPRIFRQLRLAALVLDQPGELPADPLVGVRVDLWVGPLDQRSGTGAGQSAAGAAPAVREEVEIIYRNGLRLGKLVNALLDFSRIEAGRLRARYEPVDLAVVTAELASVFRSAIELALGFDVDCPMFTDRMYVDRGMWEKVVINLLSNAAKFTFNGTIGVRLRARVITQ